MKISVVIPVYNTEKYLRQCVESVLNQTYRELQVVLVDDGSKDSSGNICDELAKKDNRIEVIHKENGGHSDARNTGINRSTGEYVLFLDSDDYWDDNKALERLIGQLKETDCDVLNFQYKKYFEDTDEFEKNKNDIEFSNEIFARGKDAQFEFLINNSLYIASACNKMIRTSLLKNNDMFFEKGVLAEDIEWSARLAISANTMWYLHFHVVCAKLSVYGLFIRPTPLIFNIFKPSNLKYYIMFEWDFCYPVQNYKFSESPSIAGG